MDYFFEDNFELIMGIGLVILLITIHLIVMRSKSGKFEEERPRPETEKEKKAKHAARLKEVIKLEAINDAARKAAKRRASSDAEKCKATQRQDTTSRETEALRSPPSMRPPSHFSNDLDKIPFSHLTDAKIPPENLDYEILYDIWFNLNASLEALSQKITDSDLVGGEFDRLDETEKRLRQLDMIDRQHWHQGMLNQQKTSEYLELVDRIRPLRVRKLEYSNMIEKLFADKKRTEESHSKLHEDLETCIRRSLPLPVRSSLEKEISETTDLLNSNYEKTNQIRKDKSNMERLILSYESEEKSIVSSLLEDLIPFTKVPD